MALFTRAPLHIRFLAWSGALQDREDTGRRYHMALDQGSQTQGESTT